jgi:beta-xylosidase
MFYTNRRANVPGLDGVSWVHGTRIGIAESRDGANWKYVDTANIEYRPVADYTHWAPEVAEYKGTYHMYLTYVPGVFTDWRHPRDIVHLTSKDLLNWKFESKLNLASERVIDACLIQLPGGGWRMWYNNELDKKSIYFADSPDLFTWTDKGKALGDRSGEGPKVFHWNDYYWMVVDNWAGLGVYRSKDLVNWQKQEKQILEKPGTGEGDKEIGQHPDIQVHNGRAYIFYFVHPYKSGTDEFLKRQSLIQAAELKFENGWITCNRDESTFIRMKQKP